MNQPDHVDVALFYRSQWQQMPGSPETSGAAFNMPFAREQGSAGASILQTRIGASSRMLANFTYQWRFQPDKHSVVSLALSAGVAQFRLDTDQLVLYDDISLDDVLRGASNSTVLPDFGFGALYQRKNTAIGFSVRHLLPNEANFNPPQGRVAENEFNSLRRHFYLTASQRLKASEMVEVVPSALVKMVPGSPVQTDLSLLAIWNKLFWGGLAWRSGDALTVLTGVSVSAFNNSTRFRLGYAFDYTASGLNAFNQGSHEIMLTASFFIGDLIPCPRDKRELKTFEQLTF